MGLMEIGLIIIEIIGSEEVIDLVTWIVGTIKNVKGWLAETDTAALQENIQDVVGTIVDMANQHLVNQQRTNELLEMLLLSSVVFITFYVLRMCLNKSAWG